MKSNIIRVYKENGQKLFDVEFGEENFEGIEAIELGPGCSSDCKYWRQCNDWEIVRRFDCQRKLDKVKDIYIYLLQC